MKKYAFGVDIGGTTVKIGLFETNGELSQKWEIPTRKEGNGSKILPDIAASLNDK
ncbi:ROK family protein, partial [Streptococcus thermophilus]|nr:ROK family protein [Streptococcus thermophilus]